MSQLNSAVDPVQLNLSEGIASMLVDRIVVYKNREACLRKKKMKKKLKN